MLSQHTLLSRWIRPATLLVVSLLTCARALAQPAPAAQPAAAAQPAPAAQPPAAAAPQRIGIVLDGPMVRGGQLLALTQEELERFAGAEKVAFPEAKTLSGDRTLATAQRNLGALLDDPEVDLIWAFGVLASHAATKRASLSKPVVAPFVIDPSAQGLTAGPTPKNLSYVVRSPSLSRDLKALRELGEVKRVAFLASTMLRQLPGLDEALRRQAALLGIDLQMVYGEDTVKAVSSIPADVDAVYVGPQPHSAKNDVEALAAALIARKLPSFSLLGRVEVERGLLMGLGSPDDGKRLARTIVVNTDAILRGETPSRLKTAFKQDENLVINMATARVLGLSLSWDVMSEAEILGAARANVRRQLSLESVVAEVAKRNLDLRANAEGLIASEESVGEARGAFFPRLEASLTGAWNDPDGASIANPERTLSWGASASQALVNEPALASFSIQKYLLDAAQYDNQSASLDAAQAATVGYINVLKSQTTEKIQRDNLKTTRTQLSLARVRQKLGTGAKSEVVRLESQLAGNRSTVINAVANRNIAEIELNRLLHRPLEEPFVLEDVSLDSSRLMAGGQRLQRYMNSPDRFRKLRTFLAKEALRNAPELRAVGSRIAAKDREALSRTLAPFVPQVSLSGTVSHRFLTGGEGSSLAAPTAAAAIPSNDFNWQVGLTASIPLWEGNARYARTARAQAEARQLELQRDASEQIVEANLRSSLHQAGAAFAAIRLQREAADAADENLRLIQEAYGRGKSNVIELLDAQNQQLVGRLNATTAVYDFLVALLNVQRAMGRFEFSMSRQDMASFFQRLSSHVEGEGNGR